MSRENQFTLDPIKFSDIGKNAFEVFSKNYPTNVLSVEVNGTESAVLFSPFRLESQTNVSSQGFLEETLEIKDPYFKGLSTNATGLIFKDGSFQSKFGFIYSNPITANASLHSNFSVDFTKGPSFTTTSSTAIKYHDILAGASITLDRNTGSIANHSYAVGLDYPNYKVSLHANDGGASMVAALYQKFYTGSEAGCRVTYGRPAASTLIEFGCKVPIDKQSYLKAKLDQTGKSALSYTTRLSDRISVTLAAAFDSLAPNDLSSRKLGCSFSVDM